jgi:glycosyltransferase involved in cell wall biosynthesis
VIVPARNERADVERCVRSILEQQVDGGVEVIVADGVSADGTAAAARAAGARVVRNPSRTTPAGLNTALAHARGEIIVRFDAHAEMPAGYVAACVEALERERGSTCVGGWRRVAGRGPWGRATARALSSRGDEPREVDTVALGSWYARELRALGGWNERFVRNQDFELNYRLRRGGGRVVFDPRIWSVYRPRESLQAIGRQYWRYGHYKALMVTEEPRSLRPRQLAPLGLLAAAAAAVAPGPTRAAGRTALAAYGALLAAAAVGRDEGWRTAVVLATMHTAWGLGFTSAFGQLLVSGNHSQDRR